jgi:hypothetical protein
MGTYRIIYFEDGDGKALGMYTLFTNFGPVVMIFGNMDHLDEVMTYAERSVPQPGAQVSTLAIAADSGAQAIGRIHKIAPKWAPGTNFVSDDEEELFDALLAGLRKQT